MSNNLLSVIFTFYANPNKDLILEREQEEIQKTLLRLDSQNKIKYVAKQNTTLKDFFSFVRSYKNQVGLFHYAGHTNSKALVFQDGEVRFESLADELKLQNKDTLKFVFLNGCPTLAHVKKLFELSVSVVIATSAKANGTQATDFAICFYEDISEGVHEQTEVEVYTDMTGDTVVLYRKDRIEISNEMYYVINNIVHTHSDGAFRTVLAEDSTPFKIDDTATNNHDKIAKCTVVAPTTPKGNTKGKTEDINYI